jgi:hypothetical protein
MENTRHIILKMISDVSLRSVGPPAIGSPAIYIHAPSPIVIGVRGCV